MIPARRESKRLPAKVLACIDGKPLIVRAVETALESGAAETVVVSTEDGAIAALARETGALVHERPLHLTGDLASAADVALCVCDELGERETVLFYPPVYPLVRPEDLADACTDFFAKQADFLISVVQTDPHDFHWALAPKGDFAELWFGDRFMADRLLLPPVYSPTGAIKVARVAALRERGNFFGERLAAFELPRERSVYVRDLVDLRLAETLLTEAFA